MWVAGRPLSSRESGRNIPGQGAPSGHVASDWEPSCHTALPFFCC